MILRELFPASISLPAASSNLQAFYLLALV
jgi:hypothetical protein